jgi:tryptophan synthase alpha chain
MSASSDDKMSGARATAPLAPRLAAAFAQPRAGTAALIPYVTGGFPSPEGCTKAVEAFIAGGADIVELGVPYSDPVADGPVVQMSAQMALAAGVTTDDVFDIAASYSTQAPFVFLVYVNNVLAYGADRFFARAAASGVEALVIPDLPVGEDVGLVARAAAAGVSIAPLVAPTSTDDRLDLAAAAASSFIYCVSITGITGARSTVGDELPELVARLRARTSAPLAVGFGIATPAHAARVAGLADGVIIGSALIKILAESETVDVGCAAVEALLKDAAAAIAAASPE